MFNELYSIPVVNVLSDLLEFKYNVILLDYNPVQPKCFENIFTEILVIKYIQYSTLTTILVLF